MKNLAIALSAVAVAYGYAPRYAYAVPLDYYYVGGHRFSCRFDYDSRFCP